MLCVKQPHDISFSAWSDLADMLLIESTSFRYVVKARPGLSEFLAQATKLFELEVYTFGTRPYADAVVRFIDPDGVYFGDRVVSRCGMHVVPVARSLLLSEARGYVGGS